MSIQPPHRNSKKEKFGEHESDSDKDYSAYKIHDVFFNAPFRRERFSLQVII
jgi:hypothetical protein